jgi:kynurenine 3-monooxygenase
MRDFVAKPEFLLHKKFERRIQQLYPEKYTPLYSLVSYSHIRYSEAYKKGQEQDIYIKQVMKENNIEDLFKNGKIDELIHSLFAHQKQSV